MTAKERIGGRPNKGRSVSMTHRCTPEWRKWLDEFADAEDEPMADIIAKSVDFYARYRRFKAPPER